MEQTNIYQISTICACFFMLEKQFSLLHFEMRRKLINSPNLFAFFKIETVGFENKYETLSLTANLKLFTNIFY